MSVGILDEIAALISHPQTRRQRAVIVSMYNNPSLFQTRGMQRLFNELGWTPEIILYYIATAFMLGVSYCTNESTKKLQNLQDTYSFVLLSLDDAGMEEALIEAYKDYNLAHGVLQSIEDDLIAIIDHIAKPLMSYPKLHETHYVNTVKVTQEDIHIHFEPFVESSS